MLARGRTSFLQSVILLADKAGFQLNQCCMSSPLCQAQDVKLHVALSFSSNFVITLVIPYIFSAFLLVDNKFKYFTLQSTLCVDRRPVSCFTDESQASHSICVTYFFAFYTVFGHNNFHRVSVLQGVASCPPLIFRKCSKSNTYHLFMCCLTA